MHDIALHLREILILLGVAGIAVPLLQRLNLSPILSYLLAGILIGPFGFGTLAATRPWLSSLAVSDVQLVGILAELGVIFLLFTIGLELSFRRLWDMRRLVLGLGGLQIILTTLAIALVAHGFGNSPEISLLLGSALALSSTAMTMQLLKDQQRLATPLGRLCFAVLLMQDLAVVPILVLLPMIAAPGEGPLLVELGRALGTALAALVGIFVVGHYLLRPLFAYLDAARKPECFFALVLFVVMGSAVLTSIAGLSAAFGAFLAGLLIAETEFRHEVEVTIEPLKGLLLGVFFFSVGMETDVSAIAQNPGWIALSVLGLLTVKSAILFLLARLFRIPLGKAAESALLLGHSGEFALMILSLAAPLHLIPPETAQFFLLVTTLSMLSAPLVALIARLLALRLQRMSGRLPEWLKGGEKGLENHIVIAGFGRAGRLLGMLLEQEGYRYLAVEQDAEKANRLRDDGYPVYYGDARRAELWRKLSADTAAAVLITIDEPKAAKEMLSVVRHAWPLLPVVMRARDVADMPSLYAAGASLVVPEMLEASLQLGRHLLQTLGRSDEAIEAAIDRYRIEE